MKKDIIIVEDDREKIIFHFAVFCELLKNCIAKYGNLTLEQADELVTNAAFLHQEMNSIMDVTYFSHEISFHWAMIILYGNNYWHSHPKYATIPKDYDAWEAAFLDRYQLTDCYEFINKCTLRENEEYCQPPITITKMNEENYQLYKEEIEELNISLT